MRQWVANVYFPLLHDAEGVRGISQHFSGFSRISLCLHDFQNDLTDSIFNIGGILALVLGGRKRQAPMLPVVVGCRLKLT